MKKINLVNVEHSNVLGTKVDFTVLCDEAPTGVVITVENPNTTVVVDEVAMSGESGTTKVYTYTYQSTDDNIEGSLRYLIESTFSTGVDKISGAFDLKDVDIGE